MTLKIVRRIIISLLCAVTAAGLMCCTAMAAEDKPEDGSIPESDAPAVILVPNAGEPEETAAGSETDEAERPVIVEKAEPQKPIIEKDPLEAKAENEAQIYQFLTETMELDNAAACGILANIEAESDFDPTVRTLDTNGLISYGICQWNGPRYTALRNYCGANGYDYRTVTGQLWYLKYELETSEKNAFDFVKTSLDTAEGCYMAGYNWAAKFERCASRYYRERARNARDTYWIKYGGTYENPVFSDDPESYPVPDRNLYSPDVGYMEGYDVLWAQSAFIRLGREVELDGVFGEEMMLATRRFQRENGLRVDGIVDDLTRQKLMDMLSQLMPGPLLIMPPAPVRLPGDINFDRAVDNTDLVMTARYIVGLDSFTEEQTSAADMNGDNTVDNADLVTLANIIIG